MGGMQVLEWGFLGSYVRTLVPMSCGPRHTAWQVAISDVQRKAIAADARWVGGHYDPARPPVDGLSLARQMAMITCGFLDPAKHPLACCSLPAVPSADPHSFSSHPSFFFSLFSLILISSFSEMCTKDRSEPAYDAKFGHDIMESQAGKRSAVEHYLDYQGEKFNKRFDSMAYYRLTQLMDTHDVGRGLCSQSVSQHLPPLVAICLSGRFLGEKKTTNSSDMAGRCDNPHVLLLVCRTRRHKGSAGVLAATDVDCGHHIRYPVGRVFC